MFQGERVLFNGSGRQTSTLNRWGDYSSLSVDPIDDCTFWYIGQYYTAASAASSTFGWVTGIGTFKFTECTPPRRGTARFVVSACGTAVPVAHASIAISGRPYGATASSGSYEATLVPGAYTFAVVRPPTYGGVASGNFEVIEGATTDIAVCLNPLPFVTIAKSADRDVVGIGSEIGFGVTLTNIGGAVANGLAFSDLLPAAPGINWAVGAGTDPAGRSSARRPIRILSTAKRRSQQTRSRGRT